MPSVNGVASGFRSSAWKTTPDRGQRAADQRRRQHARQARDEEDLRVDVGRPRRLKSSACAEEIDVLPTSGARRIDAERQRVEPSHDRDRRDRGCPDRRRPRRDPTRRRRRRLIGGVHQERFLERDDGEMARAVGWNRTSARMPYRRSTLAPVSTSPVGPAPIDGRLAQHHQIAAHRRREIQIVRGQHHARPARAIELVSSSAISS